MSKENNRGSQGNDSRNPQGNQPRGAPSGHQQQQSQQQQMKKGPEYSKSGNPNRPAINPQDNKYGSQKPGNNPQGNRDDRSKH